MSWGSQGCLVPLVKTLQTMSRKLQDHRRSIDGIKEKVICFEDPEDYDKVEFFNEFFDEISLQDLLKIVPNGWPGYPRL